MNGATIVCPNYKKPFEISDAIEHQIEERECKNSKTYQLGGLGKLKKELSTEKTQIGAIFFNPTDGGGDDFKQLADNSWLVKPRYTIMLTTFLHDLCFKAAVANNNVEGKDEKVEMIYNYLTSGEFSNCIRDIIKSYDKTVKKLDTEKKQAQQRWAAQEKIMQKLTSSLYGMIGDLQDIAGKEIIALPGLDIYRDISYTAASKNEESPKNISIAGRDEDEY